MQLSPHAIIEEIGRKEAKAYGGQNNNATISN